MGLFDKLGGGKEIQLSPKAALALAAMTVITADGTADDEELDGLRRIVRGDQHAFDSAYMALKSKPVPECIAIVSKHLNERQRLTVICNLLDLAMADGVLAGEEEKLLTEYMKSFQLREESVKSVIDTIALKNDFSIF